MLFCFLLDGLLRLLSHHFCAPHTKGWAEGCEFGENSKRQRQKYKEKKINYVNVREKTMRGWDGIRWINSSFSLSYKKLYLPVVHWNILLIQDFFFPPQGDDKGGKHTMCLHPHEGLVHPATKKNAPMWYNELPAAASPILCRWVNMFSNRVIPVRASSSKVLCWPQTQWQTEALWP